MADRDPDSPLLTTCLCMDEQGENPGNEQSSYTCVKRCEPLPWAMVPAQRSSDERDALDARARLPQQAR
jgi:hypothetical protein